MTVASIGSKVLDALSFTGGMTWEILWALILGFALSAVVQSVVSKSEMTRLLPDDLAARFHGDQPFVRHGMGRHLPGHRGRTPHRGGPGGLGSRVLLEELLLCRSPAAGEVLGAAGGTDRRGVLVRVFHR